ncbi:hypothetical protein [Pleomorphomonas sp. PLEO]|uniref:hypothetical protein n=1 Tax=Pleomorphomonas sp. PLEO TaxID=3239306 RepID=UPI00351E1D94
MILAGLDIASTTGLAILDGDKAITATWKAPKRKGYVFGDDEKKNIDPLHSGQIGCSFEDYLRSWLVDNRVEYVAIEQPLRSDAKRKKTTVDTSSRFAGNAIKTEVVPITSMATIYRLYGLSFLALSVCARFGIPARMVNQSEWRKAFLGNGSPKDAKQAAVAQCKRLGIAFSSVDACEAIGVAWWLRGELFPQRFAAADSLFNLPPTPDGRSATASG